MRAASPLSDGTYYINNVETRTFLNAKFTNAVYRLEVKQGKTADLGSTAIWLLQETEDGYYYINLILGSMVYYLQHTTVSGTLGNIGLGTMPTVVSKAKWNIIGSADSCRIVNLYSGNGLHLCDGNSWVALSGEENQSQDNNRYFWQLVNAESYQANELTAISISKNQFIIPLNSGFRFTVTQTTPSGTSSSVAMLGELSYFEFVSESVLDVRQIGKNYLFNSLECTNETVTVIHKPSGIFYTFQLTVYPISGTYHIRNVATVEYLKKASSSTLTMVGSDLSAYCNFTLSAYGNGYFYIRANGEANENSDVFLTISGNNALVLAPVVPGSDSQLWKFNSTGKNKFCIQSKADESVDKVLAVVSVSGVTSLVREEYSSGIDQTDEWYIHLQGQPTYVIPGVDEADGRHLSYLFNKTTQPVSTLFANTYRYVDSDLFFTAMQKSSVFIFGGHGAKNFVQLSNYLNAPAGQSVSYLFINEFDCLTETSLSETELVLFLSCLAAEGGVNAQNLLSKTASKGAQTVIGFTININVAESAEWGEFFLSHLVDGYSIQDAMIYADIMIQTNPLYVENGITTSNENRVAYGNVYSMPLLNQ